VIQGLLKFDRSGKLAARPLSEVVGVRSLITGIKRAILSDRAGGASLPGAAAGPSNFGFRRVAFTAGKKSPVSGQLRAGGFGFDFRK